MISEPTATAGPLLPVEVDELCKLDDFVLVELVELVTSDVESLSVGRGASLGRSWAVC